jgi:hypothetical protein
MARPRLVLALALTALVFSPGALHAQAKKPAAPKPPSQAQMQRAANKFRVVMSALQSDKVPQPVKNVLFVCLYSNPFSKITEGTDKAIAARKLDKNKPDVVLGAMAAVCGFRAEMMPKGAAPKK